MGRGGGRESKRIMQIRREVPLSFPGRPLWPSWFCGWANDRQLTSSGKMRDSPSPPCRASVRPSKSSTETKDPPSPVINPFSTPRLFDRSEAFNSFFSGDMKKKGQVLIRIMEFLTTIDMD